MRGDSRRSIRGAAGTDGVTRRGDSKRSTRVEGLDGRLKPGGAVGCGVGERVGSARGAVAVAESSGEDRGVQKCVLREASLRASTGERFSGTLRLPERSVSRRPITTSELEGDLGAGARLSCGGVSLGDDGEDG